MVGARAGLVDGSDGDPAPRPARRSPAARPEARIGRGDRVTVFGKTGSGKSTLVRQLLRGYSRAVLVDPKGRATLDDWPIVYGAEAFVRAWPATPRIIARVGPGEDRRKWIDRVMWHVWATGETAVALDETIGVVDANRGSSGVDAVWSQGRELGITAYVCTQRPSKIPPVIISEAEHVFVFRLNRRDDRELVADTIGPYNASPGPFAFTYWSERLTGAVDCPPLRGVR